MIVYSTRHDRAVPAKGEGMVVFCSQPNEPNSSFETYLFKLPGFDISQRPRAGSALVCVLYMVYIVRRVCVTVYSPQVRTHNQDGDGGFPETAYLA